VKEAYVGKSSRDEALPSSGRGRVGRIMKPFSNLTIVVREREEA
jgi:large subunit ribosomal protein L22